MVKAIVLVSIEPSHTDEIFKKVKSMQGVKEAFMVYGEYDAAFVIETEHTIGVQDFVKGIRKLTGISRTVTLIEVT
ncbi:MAG: Lrp/AsnC ligand binding domain-containing protein [Candidatus Parvarchaeota archaeon]|jgi:AsnC family.|nr:Lrp/AsnC ligand binding domain-containing protein [Candidatus Parvarchaeota archaeon]MCL5101669.1 Lrp/AsnC ligand binding domain-containing protein [Candidatus Parvarchaeota archaeon]